MRARTLPAAVLAAGIAFAPPSSAAGPQVVDKADDANYLNDNAPVILPVENPYNDNPTPVGSNPAADILSVHWRTLYERKKVVGYTVTMVLKAPPTRPGILYRTTSVSDTCSVLWLQYYSNKPSLTPQASLRHRCAEEAEAVVPIAARVQGSTVIWTVDLRAKGVPDEVTAGSELTDLGAHTRDYVDNPQCVDVSKCTTNLTQFDTTRRVDASFTIGE